MRKLVECVPNFSEGRDSKVVDQIVAAIVSAGVTLLDREMDANHNRSVITFVGATEAVEEAAFRGAKKATELINLTKHKGEHPRIGATDVVPFIPIAGVTMEDCVLMARRVASRIAKELNIPTYLYEKAATRPDRVGLENIRKGQFEGLRDEIEKNPDRAPDFGSKKIHPTAGATVVGARGPLIAYNINLNSSDLALAKEIAKSIRTSSGGFPCVKAMGLNLETRGIVQVSMNLTNYEETSIFTVFEAVRQKVAARGVEILSSEIVGLVPQRALMDAAQEFLKLENFSAEQVLENKLEALEEHNRLAASESSHTESSEIADESELRMAVSRLLFAIAAPMPTPAGGSVAALSGSLAAALGEMVCGISIRHNSPEKAEQLKVLRAALSALHDALESQFHEDAKAFDSVKAAWALPKKTDDEKSARQQAIQFVTQNATRVPMETAKKALAVLKLLQELKNLANASMASDVTVGLEMARAAVAGALANVRANLDSIKEAEFVETTRKEVATVEGNLVEITQPKT